MTVVSPFQLQSFFQPVHVGHFFLVTCFFHSSGNPVPRSGSNPPSHHPSSPVKLRPVHHHLGVEVGRLAVNLANHDVHPGSANLIVRVMSHWRRHSS